MYKCRFRFSADPNRWTTVMDPVRPSRWPREAARRLKKRAMVRMATGKHPTGQVRPARQQPAARPGNGDHPLTKTHFGQNPVHPMSGQARHAAASTRRAEATAAA